VANDYTKRLAAGVAECEVWFFGVDMFLLFMKICFHRQRSPLQGSLFPLSHLSLRG